MWLTILPRKKTWYIEERNTQGDHIKKIINKGTSEANNIWHVVNTIDENENLMYRKIIYRVIKSNKTIIKKNVGEKLA